MLKPSREHAHDLVEFLALQRRGSGYARRNSVEQRVLVPLLRRDLRGDLLREHIERRSAGTVSRSSSPRAHRVEQRGAFDQLVARQREQPPLRSAADRVARAPDALQERRDRARRAELADQIDIADVDAELQRGGRDQRLQLAALQPLLGVEPRSLARLPWCAATFSSPSRSDRCRATRSASRRVLTNTSVVRCSRDELGEPVVDLRPDLARHHRFERRRRQLQREIARARVPGVDDGASAPAVGAAGCRAPTRKRATSSMGFCVADRPMRCSFRPTSASQPLEREREMRAALVAGDGVDLVDDHRAARREHLAGPDREPSRM